MSKTTFELAEQKVKEHSSEINQRKKNVSSKKTKLIVISLLFVVFVAIGIHSVIEINEMNSPPELTKEETLQNMGSYLFMVTAQIDAFTDETGTIPNSEEDFLGEDDPYIEYLVVGDGYQLILSYADTTISYNSTDDPSQLLTEEAIEQMGITVNSQ